MKRILNFFKDDFNLYGTLALIAFAGVIFCPTIAFAGTISGLKLWATVVLPGLFVAMILTSCILALFPMNNAVSYLYVMIAGIFCGFPVGAILCGKLHEKNKSETICNRLIAFCNLSSPSFVANYIIFSSIGGRFPAFRVLLCIYLPVLEMLVYLMIRYRKEIFGENVKEQGHIKTTEKKASRRITRTKMVHILDQAITSSVKNMLKLGGYIVVFSCFAAYIVQIPFENDILTAIICGITEITNGIYLLSQLHVDIRLIVLLIVGINALGGCSTLMQTAGMTHGTGISIKKYIYYKLIFTVVTVINSAVIIYVL